MPGATLAWWRPYGVDREAHTAFTRAVHYLSREAPGGSSVDGAYLIESAAQLCGDAFGAGVVAAVRRGARRSDVLGLLRAPRLRVAGSQRQWPLLEADANDTASAADAAAAAAAAPWFDVHLSDRCLAGALRCELPRRCRRFVSAPARGFALTHQLLFHWWAGAAGCAWPGVEAAARAVPRLADLVYREAHAARDARGFDDLQAERIALGLALHPRGAELFLREGEGWVRRVAKAQWKREGCWQAEWDADAEALAADFVQKLGGGALQPPPAECDLHASALATFVLAAYGRRAAWPECGAANGVEGGHRAAAAALEDEHCEQPNSTALGATCWRRCGCCRWSCEGGWACC